MKAQKTYAFAFLFVMSTVGSVTAQEKTVRRFVEFRDGTIMRLTVVNTPWKISVVRSTGKIESMVVPPSQIKSVTLTDDENFDKKQELLSAVQQLGSDDYDERERAWLKLLNMGPAIAPDLKACLNLTADVETKARLYELLNKLQPNNQKPGQSRIGFDRFVIDGAFWGYLGDSPILVQIDGKNHPLGRKDIARITELAPGSEFTAWQESVAGFRRITPDDFPPAAVTETFETDPNNGQPLRAEDNIENTFVSRGFILSTPLKDSYIAVNNFTVAGKSGGNSIANHRPLWEGEVTIRFVQPGRQHLPAAVTHFGCYAAAVVPDGTTLIAYDLQRRELGKILTEKTNTEFLGVTSEIPIHTIRIIPNAEIDPNFTLDDFTYLFAPNVQASHPDKFLVHLDNGDSILCREIHLHDKMIQLQGLPAGLPDMTLPLDSLLRINPPPTAPTAKEEGLFAELSDGTILFAPEPEDRRKMPEFPRLPDLLKSRTDLVGLWTKKSGRKLYGKKTDQPVIWDPVEQQWAAVPYLRFLEELVLWKRDDGQFGALGYPNLTTLWLGPANTEPSPGSWHLQTIHGDDLVLDTDDPISGSLSKGVTVQWRNRRMQLKMSEIASVYRVPINE